MATVLAAECQRVETKRVHSVCKTVIREADATLVLDIHYKRPFVRRDAKACASSQYLPAMMERSVSAPGRRDQSRTNLKGDIQIPLSCQKTVTKPEEAVA